MNSFTGINAPDETVTEGTLQLSPRLLRAVRLAALTEQYGRTAPLLAHIAKLCVRYGHFRAYFSYPCGSIRTYTIRDLDVQHHVDQDPRKCHAIVTLYIWARRNNMGFVLYGEATIDPVGKEVVRGGLRRRYV